MPTKIDILKRSASRLKISGLTVDLSPNEVEEWVCYLDDYMATVLNNEYPNIGYLQPDTYGESDPNDDSGLERWMIKPVTILLADDISGSYGKKGAITYQEVSKAEDDLASGLVAVDGAKFPVTMPIGQANEYPYRFSNFYKGSNPKQPITRPTISIGFGEINDYKLDLRQYLDGEIVSTYSIDVSAGLSLISDSEDDSQITYRIRCGDSVGDRQTVSIFVETDTARQKYFIINVKAENLNNNGGEV